MRSSTELASLLAGECQLVPVADRSLELTQIPAKLAEAHDCLFNRVTVRERPGVNLGGFEGFKCVGRPPKLLQYLAGAESEPQGGPDVRARRESEGRACVVRFRLCPQA